MDPHRVAAVIYDPARGVADLGNGLSHLVVQVESLDTALTSSNAPATS